jgi:hypothetical protein
VQADAWLKRVEITDAEIGDQAQREQLENTLTNNLLQFLREGKYFRRIELLPGNPHPGDPVLQFRFNRYRQGRHLKLLSTYDTSDVSATLNVTQADGEFVNEVTASVKEEHLVGMMTAEEAIPSGMRARSQVIEELLEKAFAELDSSH